MAFLAERDGERVIPEQVSDGETVTCLSCGSEMSPRGPSTDGRARHFVHLPNAASCDGKGESDEHRKMKSLAVSKLRQVFDGEFARCAPEVHLDVSHTGTDAKFRRADALVEFDYAHPVYGSGLIVEVQFRNKGKEIPIVTRDYLECEYSVYWALSRDFTETEFIFDRLETAFESNTVFAHSVSRFSKGDLKDVDETDLLWQDPIPDCDHVWKEFDELEYCARCRINRTYSYERTRYLYDNMGFLGPLERPDVPKVPDPGPPERTNTQSSTTTAGTQHGYGGWDPLGIPDCDYGEHDWKEHWANQHEAVCRKCDVSVDVDRLQESATQKLNNQSTTTTAEIPPCDSILHDTPEHNWVKYNEYGTVQCNRCYMTVTRERLPDSAEIKDQSSKRKNRIPIDPCDEGGDHSWADTGRTEDVVQCVKCYDTVDRDRLPDSAEVEESWW